MEGRKLLTDICRGEGLPYCCVTTGSHQLHTTKTDKKSRNPCWNECFELLVKKGKKKLEVTVMARDKDGDEFLGSKYSYQYTLEIILEMAPL
jgi:Ca2+-dependent lipid-binding protein